MTVNPLAFTVDPLCPASSPIVPTGFLVYDAAWWLFESVLIFGVVFPVVRNRSVPVLVWLAMLWALMTVVRFLPVLTGLPFTR